MEDCVMSIPAFAWAIEQGQLVDEMTTNHLVLMIMGNEANRFGELVMGQPRLAKLTKLTVRTVRVLLHDLVRWKRVERLSSAPGKRTCYKLLTPATAAGEETAAAVTPATVAGVDPQPRQMTTQTPATVAARPFKESLKKERDPPV